MAIFRAQAGSASAPLPTVKKSPSPPASTVSATAGSCSLPLAMMVRPENLFASVNIPSPGRYKYNWMQLKDAKLDKLFEDGRAVTDQGKRDAVYAEAQKIIMDSAVWLPIHNQVQTLAHRTEKKGYHFARASWIALFYDVTRA